MTRLTGKDRIVASEARRAQRAERVTKRAAELAPTIAEINASGVTSLNGMAKELTKRGVLTVRGAKTWSAVQVQRILLEHR